jgi:phospholipid-binding lipoprotein MlaA
MVRASNGKTPNRTGMLRFLSAALLAVLMVSGCATAPPPEDSEAVAAFEEANDAIEPFNRGVFEVNLTLDRIILKPIATVYRDFLPEFAKDAVFNFFNNLRSPVIFVNDLLQAEGERAGITFARFLINSTVGLAGFIDVADNALELPYHDEDFGQTLAVWGVDEGFYVMLPVFGPSTVRDAVGLAVDTFFDPFTYLMDFYDHEEYGFVRSGTDAVDERSRNIDTLDELEATSLDFYATIRSLYRQRREDQIRQGEPSADRPTPGISLQYNWDELDGEKSVVKDIPEENLSLSR